MLEVIFMGKPPSIAALTFLPTTSKSCSPMVLLFPFQEMSVDDVQVFVIFRKKVILYIFKFL